MWSSALMNLTGQIHEHEYCVQIDEEQMVMLGGSADTASHALLYNLTSGQSTRLTFFISQLWILTRLEDMLVPRLGQHGCSLLRNETWSGVLVAGGVNSNSLLDNAEVGIPYKHFLWAEEIMWKNIESRCLTCLPTSGSLLAISHHLGWVVNVLPFKSTFHVHTDKVWWLWKMVRAL